MSKNIIIFILSLIIVVGTSLYLYQNQNNFFGKIHSILENSNSDKILSSEEINRIKEELNEEPPEEEPLEEFGDKVDDFKAEFLEGYIEIQNAQTFSLGGDLSGNYNFVYFMITNGDLNYFKDQLIYSKDAYFQKWKSYLGFEEFQKGYKELKLMPKKILLGCLISSKIVGDSDEEIHKGLSQELLNSEGKKIKIKVSKVSENIDDRGPGPCRPPVKVVSVGK